MEKCLSHSDMQQKWISAGQQLTNSAVRMMLPPELVRLEVDKRPEEPPLEGGCTV